MGSHLGQHKLPLTQLIFTYSVRCQMESQSIFHLHFPDG